MTEVRKLIEADQPISMKAIRKLILSLQNAKEHPLTGNITLTLLNDDICTMLAILRAMEGRE